MAAVGFWNWIRCVRAEPGIRIEPASIVDSHRFRGGSCPLTSLRSDRARRSGRSWRTRRSRRTGEAAILYDHISRIRSGRDLHDAGGGKFRSDPPKPSSRSALDLDGLTRADLDLHAGLAGPPDASDDDQLALRYGGRRDQYFRMCASSAHHRIGDHKSCDGADGLREHHHSLLLAGRLTNRVSCQVSSRGLKRTTKRRRADSSQILDRLSEPKQRSQVRGGPKCTPIFS